MVEEVWEGVKTNSQIIQKYMVWFHEAISEAFKHGSKRVQLGEDFIGELYVVTDSEGNPYLRWRPIRSPDDTGSAA
jgi:hypothetical protein